MAQVYASKPCKYRWNYRDSVMKRAVMPYVHNYPHDEAATIRDGIRFDQTPNLQRAFSDSGKNGPQSPGRRNVRNFIAGLDYSNSIPGPFKVFFI